MNWCFGIVNNKLAEVYFEKNKDGVIFLGHCYVEKDEYSSKKEKGWIKQDIHNVRLVYRNKEYRQVK